jgi:hypothetical protein
LKVGFLTILWAVFYEESDDDIHRHERLHQIRKRFLKIFLPKKREWDLPLIILLVNLLMEKRGM